MPLIDFIPEKYEAGFRNISDTEDSDFSLILKSIDKCPLSSSLKELSNKAVIGTDLNPPYLEEIFLSVGSLMPYLEEQEIIDDLVLDISGLAIEEGLIKDEHKFIFEDRLKILLKNKNIYYAFKAEKLNTGYGNVYLSSKIISDIRPVFDISVKEDPIAATIIHNLNIHYQSNEEPFHKDITIILDTKDIEDLKQILARAEEKNLSLKSILKRSGIINLNE